VQYLVDATVGAGFPAWPGLQWKVTPLRSFAARAAIERGAVASLEGG
jgi:hypothetical protein